jgi:hypothetical protein
MDANLCVCGHPAAWHIEEPLRECTEPGCVCQEYTPIYLEGDIPDESAAYVS